MRTTDRLSDRDKAVLRDVTRFRQMTGNMLERLYFSDGSPLTSNTKQCRAMTRLYKWGLVNRIGRALGGWSGGSEGYVYVPTTSKARAADAHTLDIAELYVTLKTQPGPTTLQTFEPEAWAQTRVGHIELKPDAYVEMVSGEYVDPYFIEVDRGTEFASQLSRKMRHYTSAYNKWDVERDGESFPVVLWIVPDEARKRFMENVVRKQEVPDLFQVAIDPNPLFHGQSNFGTEGI